MCNICGKIFFKYATLYAHRRIHLLGKPHKCLGYILCEIRTTPYSCLICPKQCITKYTLNIVCFLKLSTFIIFRIHQFTSDNENSIFRTLCTLQIHSTICKFYKQNKIINDFYKVLVTQFILSFGIRLLYKNALLSTFILTG